MTIKEIECLFTSKVKGDSLLQLKDGRLLFYYFRTKYRIKIYNEKSFQKILAINLFKAIYEYEKEKGNIKEDGKSIKKEELKDEEDEIMELRYSERIRYVYYDKEESKSKNSIKELSNGIILIGRDYYLIELNIKEDTYESKVINKLNEVILDINELPDKRIIVITNNDIIIFNIEKENYIIKKEYPIKDTWKIVPVSSRHEYYGGFHQYYSSELLPNNRLLLNSFSTELSFNSGCGTNPPFEFSHSKIIFINTNNFQEIKTTELFKSAAKCIIFNNIIVIQNYTNLLIYDINSLELIKLKEIIKVQHYIYKYDEKYIITISKEENENWINVYKKQNSDMIKYSELGTNVDFDIIIGWNGNVIKGYNNKFLFTLKDKRVIIICHNKMYALKLKME